MDLSIVFPSLYTENPADLVVPIRWTVGRLAGQKAGRRLDWSRLLYALVDPDMGRIVYIGLAFDSTVASRLKDKAEVEKRVGRSVDDLHVLLGEFRLDPEPTTKQLRTYFGDSAKGERTWNRFFETVESLLIYGLEPDGNIEYRENRTAFHSMNGLLVSCDGNWPAPYDIFLDNGPGQLPRCLKFP